MIKVFHSVPFAALAYMKVTTAVELEKLMAADGIKFKHVADVATDELEEAWERTNTIHDYWWLNEGVTKKFEGDGTRSTSVGDVVEHNGQIFLAKSVGFQCLGPAFGPFIKE